MSLLTLVTIAALGLVASAWLPRGALRKAARLIHAATDRPPHPLDNAGAARDL